MFACRLFNFGGLLVILGFAVVVFMIRVVCC